MDDRCTQCPFFEESHQKKLLHAATFAAAALQYSTMSEVMQNMMLSELIAAMEPYCDHRELTRGG